MLLKSAVTDHTVKKLDMSASCSHMACCFQSVL